MRTLSFCGRCVSTCNTRMLYCGTLADPCLSSCLVEKTALHYAFTCDNSISDNTHFTGNKGWYWLREFPQRTKKHKTHNITLLWWVQFMRAMELRRSFPGENCPKWTRTKLWFDLSAGKCVALIGFVTFFSLFFFLREMGCCSAKCFGVIVVDGFGGCSLESLFAWDGKMHTLAGSREARKYTRLGSHE